MKKFLKILLLIISIIALIITGLIYFYKKLPYKKILKNKIISTAKDYNIEIKNLEIDIVSKNKARISNLIVGNDNGITANDIILSYYWIDLLEGKLENLSIDNANITSNKIDNEWQVSGIKLTDTNTKETEELSLNESVKDIYQNIINISEYSKYIPDESNISNSLFVFDGEDIKGKVPFNIFLKKTPNILGELKFNKPSIKFHEYKFTSEEASLNIKIDNSSKEIFANLRLDNFFVYGLGDDIPKFDIYSNSKIFGESLEGKISFHDSNDKSKFNTGIEFKTYPEIIMSGKTSNFLLKKDNTSIKADELNFIVKAKDTQNISGSLSIPNLNLSIPDTKIPPLDSKLKFNVIKNQITVNLDISGPEKKYILTADVISPVSDFTKAYVNINKAQFKWGDGLILIKDKKIPLNITKPIKLKINIKDVNVSDIIDLISDGRIYGTGKITGEIPIIYYPDGRIDLENVVIETKDTGKIVVSPDLLPGDNEQIKMVRKTLNNFDYTKLKISVLSEGEKGKEKSVVKLLVAGKNPDANNGREVILNINVSGDLMPLIQQSLIPFDNLKEIINIKN